MMQFRFFLPLLLLATPLIAQEGEPMVMIAVIDDQWSASESTVLPTIPKGAPVTYPLSSLPDGIEGLEVVQV